MTKSTKPVVAYPVVQGAAWSPNNNDLENQAMKLNGATKLTAIMFGAAVAVSTAAQVQDSSGGVDFVSRDDAYPPTEQPVHFSDEQRFRVLEMMLDFSDAHGFTGSVTDRIQTGQVTVKYQPPADSGERSATVFADVSAGGIAGYVECDIQAHNPHAGQGPGGKRMVKAKASGGCEFNWTGPAEGPPIIKWDLYMLLRKSGSTVGSSRHTRYGLEVEWRQNPPDATQVFHDDGACENGYYTNFVGLNITLPGGWYLVNASNPIYTASRSASVGNC